MICAWVEVLEPRISAQFGGCGPVFSSVLHASDYDTSGSRWYMLRDIQIPNNNLTIQLLIVLASEWELSAEECKEKNARSIDVCWWSAELDLLDDLWSHIGWSSAEELDHLLVWNAG